MVETLDKEIFLKYSGIGFGEENFHKFIKELENRYSNEESYLEILAKNIELVAERVTFDKLKIYMKGLSQDKTISEKTRKYIACMD